MWSIKSQRAHPPPSASARPRSSPNTDKQTLDVCRDYDNVITRKVLRDAWNKQFLQTAINGHGRVIDPFRAANNLGDYLSRPYYTCGIHNDPVPRRRPGWGNNHAHQTCDGKGVPGSSCNPKYVSDSSDYTRFKKQNAMLAGYH